jgi:hypothetical protein
MTKVKITPARQLVDRSAGILRVERKMNKATIIAKRGQRGPSGASVVSLSNPVHKVARARRSAIAEYSARSGDGAV